MYLPLWYHIYPKVFIFDLVNNEFSFTDIYPSGTDSNDGVPMKPWDIDDNDYISFHSQAQGLNNGSTF